MRIDLFLKKILIFQNREDAKLVCDKNLVKVNGKYSKPAKNIEAGDLIELETFQQIRKIKVLKLPEGNVRKDEAGLYYEEISL